MDYTFWIGPEDQFGATSGKAVGFQSADHPDDHTIVGAIDRNSFEMRIGERSRWVANSEQSDQR
jgi:hypothetical protein